MYHIGWGMRFFFSGLGMIFRHPALLGLSLVPIAVTVVLLVGLALGAAWAFGQLIGGEFDNDFRALAQAAIFVLALLAGYFFYLPLARVLLAPFAEALSRKTHSITTGEPYRSNQKWSRAIWEGVKLAALHVLIGLVAIIIGFAFPPIGVPVGIAIAVFVCGLDFFDVPLAARGLRLGEKLRVIFSNKSLAIGFGIAAYLMLLIPLVNLLSLPVGVIGATLLTDQVEPED